MLQNIFVSKTKSSFLEYFPVVVIYGLLLALALIFIFPEGTRAIYFGLAWASAFVWLYERGQPTKPVKWLLYMMLFFVVYRAGYAMWDAGRLRWINGTERTIFATIFFLGYLSSKSVIIPRFNRWFSWVLHGLMLLSAVLSMLTMLYLSGDRTHFWGEHNAIRFSAIAVMLFFVYFGLYLKKGEYKYSQTLNLLSCLFFILVCVYFSATRNTLFTLILITGFMYFMSNIPYKKWVALIVVVGIVLGVVTYGSKVTSQLRLNEIVPEISQYQDGSKGSSIGMRFEMWRAAILSAKEAPFFGGGYTQRTEIINRLVEEKKINPFVLHFTNLHSDYLEEISVRGVFGLFVLLSLYFSMIRFCFLCNRTKKLSLTMLSLTMAYMIFGLVDNFLIGRMTMIIFCLLYVLIFIVEQDQTLIE